MGTAIDGHLAAGRHGRAFDLIVPEYKQRVFRLAYTMLKDRAAAEDATQETLVRVWKALPAISLADKPGPHRCASARRQLYCSGGPKSP